VATSGCGFVLVNGAELIGMATHQIGRGHAALVPEGRRLFGNQSVEDNLILGSFHLRRDSGRVPAPPSPLRPPLPTPFRSQPGRHFCPGKGGFGR